MFKSFLPMFKINFGRIIWAVNIRNLCCYKTKKWYVYAAQTIFFVLFPVFVEAVELFPSQMFFEFNHGFFVSPKILIENIPVTKGGGFQSMDSNIKSNPEFFRGFYKSLSVIPQNLCNIYDDGSHYDTENGRYLYCPKLKLRLDFKWTWDAVFKGCLIGLIWVLFIHFLFCHNDID